MTVGIGEGDLKEAKVIVSVANELGLFDGVYLDDALAALYPGLFDGVKPLMMSLTRWWQK